MTWAESEGDRRVELNIVPHTWSHVSWIKYQSSLLAVSGFSLGTLVCQKLTVLYKGSAVLGVHFFSSPTLRIVMKSSLILSVSGTKTRHESHISAYEWLISSSPVWAPCAFTGNHPFVIKLTLKKLGIFSSTRSSPDTSKLLSHSSFSFSLFPWPVRKSLESLLAAVQCFLGEDTGWFFIHAFTIRRV